MDLEKLHAIGTDMGLTESALQEWVQAERVIERDLRAQARDEQREKIALEERRLQAEERVLQLKLKLQEPTTGSNTGEIRRPSPPNTYVSPNGCQHFANIVSANQRGHAFHSRGPTVNSLRLQTG
ncbi:hypothetical protein HPB51_027891 [Rhipicephalus microplus]|uniref:Uncharacterized protein n=1 Tax=Rhipicephalus microplus TaxID=6941 RepID=A0A9J6CYU3_RHIMP|nr:hypothetical protein HPB51_027891 [Rhipicephalus microplus]